MGADGAQTGVHPKGFMVFSTTDGAAAPAERMRITSGGNVGIGYNAPADILDVRKNQNATTNFFFRNTDTTDTSSRAFINVIAGGTTLTMGCLNAGDTYFAGTAGKTMYFQQSFGGAVNMEITSGGYIKLGATTAPAIKMKKLTGTTASTEGGTIIVAHGLTGDKIISITAKVMQATNYGLLPESVEQLGYQYHFWHDNINAILRTHTTNSENILSKPFVVTIFYEE